ncbi:hairy-related 3 [Myripristis murdjan]|uniref:hairy-related 3 n=1 Tax=Myripristis murdjan TaxID=586833 RepID=UPI001175DBDF|nr:transcription factor HES-3 [Myripristis murdjan]
MVSTSDCIVKSKPIAANKVSKPLMEKKRRARINKCLDQLKSLLESYYANSIRKRKLEKADILELTVKHLRNLQKTQSCPSSASELPDYHAGFRSCLASVNQYLRMADNMSGSDRWMLSQLSNKLCCSRGPGEVSSTSDSDLSKTQEAAMQRLQPSSAAPEGRKTPKTKSCALKPPCGSTGRTCLSLPTQVKEELQTSGPKRALLAAIPTQNTLKISCSAGHSSKFHSVTLCRNEVVTTQQSVWRPW